MYTWDPGHLERVRIRKFLHRGHVHVHEYDEYHEYDESVSQSVKPLTPCMEHEYDLMICALHGIDRERPPAGGARHPRGRFPNPGCVVESASHCSDSHERSHALIPIQSSRVLYLRRARSGRTRAATPAAA